MIIFKLNIIIYNIWYINIILLVKKDNSIHQKYKKMDFIHSKNRFSKGFIGHKHNICCVVFTQNHRILISGSDDKTIKLWSF